MIDNAEAYDALIAAVREARESIWITQLAFDADCKAYASDASGPHADAHGESLLEVILAASMAHRVNVKILLNSTLLLDTKRPLLRFLARTGQNTELLELRGISRFPQLLHAKMVIVDESRAFLMGSPFVNGYWDTPAHPATDSRRPSRELGGRPVHDVSVGVRGPVVQELAQIFARLWNDARNAESISGTELRAHASSSKAGELGLSVATTEPRASRQPNGGGSRQTLDALLDGIGRARSLIYIEHQYLSSRPVVEALRAALKRERSLELIAVLNQNADVTAYRRWQNTRLADTGLLAHPRVGLFALWTRSREIGSRPAINQVFIHSKVMIVDDEWAMVGSANLDGVSLDSYGDDFSGRVARRVFRDVRNFDVSIVLANREHSRRSNPIRELRERLWLEHFGNRSFEGSDDSHKSELLTWKALASRNVEALNGFSGGEAAPAGGSFVLPYSMSSSPRAQLGDVGVRTAASFDLRFDPGWLEVNFSPNWIRNMFL